MFNIEAVTVCIGYHDFLAEAAKYNTGLFNDWVIVTVDSDEETREVCRKHSIRTILTGDYKRQGEPFNKGRLVERGLQHLSARSWRLHLDADIILPHVFHQLIDAADLNPDNIYGCDRIMVRSAKQWDQLKKSEWMTHKFHCQVDSPHGLKVGSRWSHHEVGYVPIGFFQLWNAKADLWRGARIRPYPTLHNDACRSDVQHSLQWDRRHRELLPELYVAHLESESAANGANWCGRKTKPFIPYGC